MLRRHRQWDVALMVVHTLVTPHAQELVVAHVMQPVQTLVIRAVMEEANSVSLMVCQNIF